MTDQFTLTTADPRFKPTEPVTINGFSYALVPSKPSEDDHKRFTVDGTAYLRNLDHEDLRARCIAIHYQKRPKRNPETKTTSYGLRFPMLILAHYLETPEPVAEKVAAILNEHWPEEGDDA